MKKIASFLCAALLAVAVRAADTVPQFNATLTVGKENRFVLVDQAGNASGFLGLGEKFAGYTIKAFDAKSNTLDLERDGKVTQVTLIGGAGITNGPGATTATKATVADAEALFRKMRFEEMMAKLMDGQKKAMGPALEQQMGQSLGRIAANLSPEDRAALTKAQSDMMDEILSVITGPEMRNAMTKVYSDVFTKEEMESMTAFYSTPAGQALIDKQPAVQEQMMGTLMPLMMQKQQSAQQKMTSTITELAAKNRAARAGGAGGAPMAPAPTAPVAPKN